MAEPVQDSIGDADTRYIGIILFDGFEELDAIGPLEVFGMSRELLSNPSLSRELLSNPSIGQCQDGAASPVKYRTITITVPGTKGGNRVRASNGLTVLADYAADDKDSPLPLLDIILVPGGRETDQLSKVGDVSDWLSELCQKATWVTSVCTGVSLLLAAGYAKGKRIATHFMAEDMLEASGDVTVVRGQRWVVDGNLVTSQGVSAGIDMSLWLVGQLHSPDHARLTQKFMQYEPSPPYQS